MCLIAALQSRPVHPAGVNVAVVGCQNDHGDMEVEKVAFRSADCICTFSGKCCSFALFTVPFGLQIVGVVLVEIEISGLERYCLVEQSGTARGVPALGKRNGLHLANHSGSIGVMLAESSSTFCASAMRSLKRCRRSGVTLSA